MPSGINQVTQWLYGYSGSGKYTLNSNDVLVKEELPDPTTGQPSTSSSSDQSYTYDDLGEQMKLVDDENGTIQAYTYDVLGRTTSDSVSLLGSGVDGTVTSLSYAYDTNGQLLTATSNGSSGILNQVEEAYNGLGQLVGEYQSHSGAVTIGSTPEVQYLFQSLSGSTSDGRATGMIYPNGRQEDYVYNTGLDSNVSRVSAIADDSGTGSGNIESYSYLGLGTIVQRTRPNNTDLTYIGSSAGPAGDDYTGLDEFGRVIDQNWQTTSSGTAIDRYQYGYDADSNVLYQLNLSSGTYASSYSELFHLNGSSNGYDNLNRLTDFERGTLNSTHDSITGTAGETQDWTLDALGNWTTFTTNSTGQSRSANARNEYTGVGSSTPTYDNNGNLTKDEAGQQYVYDAWNRLKQVKNSSGTVLVTYSYDALGRRIVEAVSGGTTTDVYFDTAGNDIEERQGSTVTTQYVWGLGAPDQLILRDDNTTSGSYGFSGSGLGRRIFVQQDANQNVTALVSSSGSVLERFAYDPYGKRYVLDVNWNSTTDGYNWLYGFQGGRQDPTSGLVHFGAPGRDYSTSLGRWTEPDPAGYINGASLYQADGSSPADRIDPSGMYMLPGGGSPNGHEERIVVQGNGSVAVINKWVPNPPPPPGTMEPMDMAGPTTQPSLPPQAYLPPNYVPPNWSGPGVSAAPPPTWWDWVVEKDRQLAEAILNKVIASQNMGPLGCLNHGNGIPYTHYMTPDLRVDPAPDQGVQQISGYIDAAGILGAMFGGIFDSVLPGELTPWEIDQNQNVVNDAGVPVKVGGSTARGARIAGHDIDYVVRPESYSCLAPHADRLPGINLDHGLLPEGPTQDWGAKLEFTPKGGPK